MQQLIEGKNSINNVGSAILKAGYNSVFVITGKHLVKENYLHFLKDLQISHFVKQGVNVDDNEIEIAHNEFKKNANQALLAIGGGSVIDLAKGIIYRCIADRLPVPFFVAVPTTAGSGTEATHFAVVYSGKKKQSLVHQSLLPRIAVLDPVLTYFLPSYQSAVSGMDVITQAVESFWNKNSNTESKQYAEQAIILWNEYFIKAVVKNDETAREKMLYASHVAGKAINITRTTGPHALSYYLTANHIIPHGQAVGLFLPLFFIYNNAPKELCNLFGQGNATETAYFIKQKMKEAGLAIDLASLEVNKEVVIDDLLDEVNEERFANNPVSFNRNRLKELILEQL